MNKERANIISLIVFIAILLISCQKQWDEYFSSDPSYVDHSVWEEIAANPDYSQFKSYIEQLHLKSFFQNNDSLLSTKTVLVPTNEAFDQYFLTHDSVTASQVLYHLIKSQFLLANVDGNRKIQTQNGKFLYFEEIDGQYFVDGINITGFQNRFSDGLIYIMNEVLIPKPSIGEYIHNNAAYFSYYISSFDTLIMDYSNSEIISIDNDDNKVIYDSVYSIYNSFKSKYFDVDRNTRDTFATLLLYTNDQFDDALDTVAYYLGYPDGQNLPYKWIKEVYFGYYLKSAFFDGLLSYSDLQNQEQVNILGDTVAIDPSNINPEKVICSNGLIYQYNNLNIPEDLYKNLSILEGESLVETSPDGLKFVDGVETSYYDADGNRMGLEGKINYVLGAAGTASNDSAIQISLGSKFTGAFTLEIPVNNVFPGRYFLDWAGFSTTTGIFRLYVNDSLLYTRLPFYPLSDPGSLLSDFDSYNFGNFTCVDLSKHENGVDIFSIRNTINSWNINEFYVEGDPSDPDEFYIREFGDVRLKFEFISFSPDNENNAGLVIDYLKFRMR